MSPVDTLVPYEVIWRCLQLSVLRYGSMPSGQLLTVFTIIILSHLDHDPTVGELAEITGLPKSSVSRYVSGEMNSGYLEEYIDTEDRRRRKLRPTRAAIREQQWHQAQLKHINDLRIEAEAGNRLDAAAVIQQMKELAASTDPAR